MWSVEKSKVNIAKKNQTLNSFQKLNALKQQFQNPHKGVVILLQEGCQKHQNDILTEKMHIT